MSEALEGTPPSESQLEAWIEAFHRDGFLVVPSLLSRQRCHRLRADLDRILAEREAGDFTTRLFEDSPENLALFDLEPMVTFAEELIGRCNGIGVSKRLGIPRANHVHVIHNNSFLTPGLTHGLGGSAWHQDDTPHILSLDGEPLKNVRLNVLCFTVNYYLTDVVDLTNGPTQMIRGSHLFGALCQNDVEDHEDEIVSALGPAGTAVCFNNQVWHRGAPNLSETTRAITQVTYAKRLVGHKFGSVMNYQMPPQLTEDLTPRRRRLFGFLEGGAYS